MKKSLEKVLIKGKSFFKLNFYRSVVMDSFTIELVSNAWILSLLSWFPTLLIVIRIIVFVLLQTFYPNKYIRKENGRLLFQKYDTLLCTKMLQRESLHW